MKGPDKWDNTEGWGALLQALSGMAQGHGPASSATAALPEAS